jgi:putative nucleotidyltransferase with HDIG domain
MVRLFQGIRFKLSVLIFLLVALLTGISSAIVMNIMESFALREMVKRGQSLAESASSAAGYSMISGDILALDNLMAKLKESQKDILFVATADERGFINAHSELGNSGKPYPQRDGHMIISDSNATAVREVRDGETKFYEFRKPMVFAGKKLGDLYLGIDASSLIAASSVARKKIISVAVAILAIGVIGTIFLSNFITKPIKSLTGAVSELSSGKYEREIPFATRDEIGELIQNFNKMARTIIEQNLRLQNHAREIEESFVATVKVLSAAIDARDPYTLGHSTRVAGMALLVGGKLGLSKAQLKELELVSLFHDVGKIRTPDHILQKKAPLNNEEVSIMMRHAEDGAEILKLVAPLQNHIPAVLHHHEWFDGTGYPNGLKGEEIPLFAAIISIADAYDAMTSSRSYRKAKTREQATGEIRKFKGKQFDPHISDLFIELIETLEDARSQQFIEVSK